MPDIIADKYEVLETIGRGGMGTVYKARQTNLDRIVAIKMLSEELASDPEFRARFQQEATVVARLNHPNIVQVHDIEPHNNTFCIIMEFVDGENLQAKIDRDVTLPEQEVVTIGAQVSRALSYAHSKGIIHRDIKPDNIHVTPKGVAKVMDFGIARFLDSKLKTQTGISMGTPKFMSPEQVTGKNVDGQTDLYSLGICLYYCLAGRPPFDGENAISVATRHLYEQPEPPSKLNPSISPAVEAVILKALEKQKANRYLTGVEMAEALEGVLRAKSPARVGGGDERYADATQKMPAQSFNGIQTTPLPQPLDDTDYQQTVSPNTSPAAYTPLSNRTVPELDPEFRTPRGDLTTGDPTRSFRLSLVVFGALVFFAVLLLILLVIWLRSSDNGSGAIADLNTRQVSPIERLESVDSEAARLDAAGKVAEARGLWLKFKDQNPDVAPDKVSAELRELEGRLPLNANKDIIAERRMQLGREHFKQRELAVASAYFAAATELSDKVLSSTMEGPLLKSTLNNPPDESKVKSAADSYEKALTRISNDQWDDETGAFLVKAVEDNFLEARYWASLGDFFLRRRDTDDARVMYREAAQRADPALKSEIAKKAASLSK